MPPDAFRSRSISKHRMHQLTFGGEIHGVQKVDNIELSLKYPLYRQLSLSVEITATPCGPNIFALVVLMI